MFFNPCTTELVAEKINPVRTDLESDFRRKIFVIAHVYFVSIFFYCIVFNQIDYIQYIYTYRQRLFT